MGILLNTAPKVSADGKVIGPLRLPLKDLGESVAVDMTDDATERSVDVNIVGPSNLFDLSKLEVCFGGFSPMALNDTVATNEQIEASQRFLKERREALERAAAMEDARASEIRTWEDEAGNLWSYVVLDDSEVRIINCESNAKELTIPSYIEGKPVVALSADACSELPEAEVVICPDTVINIGYCAFRNCAALRKAVLPIGVTDFDSGWFRRCTQLEDLALPGGLQEIKPGLFDCPSLKRLRVGKMTSKVKPGAFAKSQLESIEIDSDNPFLETDGFAIYTKGKDVLVSLAVPVWEYSVATGCQGIGKKAMNSFGVLKKIQLPESVSVIGEYAFSHTSLEEFVAPISLEVIAERAFFDCINLQSVTLNDKLRVIGNNAFTKTGISELRIPSSIEELGHPIAANSKLVYSGNNPTFTIADGSALFVDRLGGIYRKAEDGFHMVQLEDSEVTNYEVAEGTVSIEERAVANHKKLKSVKLPSSLRIIGKAAFKGCQALQSVQLPSGLERIDAEAFLGASIEQLELPENLEYIGETALVMHGAHHGADAPTLHSLTVHANNKRFRVDSSLLLEILPDGSERVIHCMDSEPVVRVPESVKSIAPYAFNGDRNIRELYISDRIADVGVRGLAIDCRIDLIHIDLDKPIEGHDHFDICFPDTDRGEHQMYLGLTVPRFVDVEGLLDHYDNTIVNASNFDSVFDGGLALYEQAKRILDRLEDPIFMSSVNRSLAERFIANNLANICVEIARHDDRVAIDSMCDMGFLNGDNLPEVIDHVGKIQDAAMTGYLLELKRVRFGLDAFDFEL